MSSQKSKAQSCPASETVIQTEHGEYQPSQTQRARVQSRWLKMDGVLLADAPSGCSEQIGQTGLPHHASNENAKLLKSHCRTIHL